MKIRDKILLSFSTVTILLVAITFVFIYILFSEYREEEFQQQQNKKIHSTIQLIEQFKKESAAISGILDAQDINDFYDEKLLVYDSDKALIFSSLDDLSIRKRIEILNELSPSRQWIETKEENYDLIGVYLESKGKSYYAISKAYDAFGYDKLVFLKQVLLIIFAVIAVVVLIVSLYIANNIAKPINRLTLLLHQYDLHKEDNQPLNNETGTSELSYLTARFNELLQRSQEAFIFQKHTVDHISHQLKTPIAVLVSELESIVKVTDMQLLKRELEAQVERAKALGDIINTLLEISKIESGKNFHLENIRLDEIIFDLLEQLGTLYPEFHFQISFVPESFTEQQMEVSGSKLLLYQAFQNLLINCVRYSDNAKAWITIDCSQVDQLFITISNQGLPITAEEQKLLFQHFFRGENSRGKAGSGLGLILTQKIIYLHKGEISYHNEGCLNTFRVGLPR